jgi:putative membrane protein
MHISSRRRSIAYVMLVAALFYACADSSDDGDDAAQDSVPAQAPVTAPAGPPNDAQIAHIATTANTIDIDLGNLARSKTQNPDIRAFAETMIADHGAVNQQAGDLAGKIGVAPSEHATSQQMSQDALAVKQQLINKTGAEFDLGYISQEVAFHQKVLAALDSTLIPGAQNAELKTFLEGIRPAIAAHLQRAQQIQQSLTPQ